jgi:phosphoglycolate phosphatase
LLDQAAGEQMPRYRKKPAPDLVNLILDALHVAPERAVYVGDSDVDLETAKNAGLACIAVDWGFRSREFLLAHGADTMVSSAQELEQQILGTPAAFSEKK